MSQPPDAPPPSPAPRVAEHLRDLFSPRLNRGRLGIAVLCAVLGFALVVQVRSTNDSVLERSRRTDLVQILEEISQRSTRLEQEVSRLQVTRDELQTGANRRQAALEEAQQRARTLAVLAGTTPVRGSGIVLTLSDPDGKFGAAGLLGAVQELRAADAEAIEIRGANDRAVRVVVSTSFTGTDTGVAVDAIELTSPYRITAIGDADSLAGAMRFPRGVIAQVESEDVGGSGSLSERDSVTIDTVAPTPSPAYASPAPGGAS